MKRSQLVAFENALDLVDSAEFAKEKTGAMRAARRARIDRARVRSDRASRGVGCGGLLFLLFGWEGMARR